jgi:hypothetical protein
MRDLDDSALELRLRGVLREHLGSLPLEIDLEDLERRGAVRDAARRRRRGLVVLGLAAAILLPLGVLGAGGQPMLQAIVLPEASASPDPSAPAEATAGPAPVVLREWSPAEGRRNELGGPGRFRIEGLVAGRAVDLTLPSGWTHEYRNVNPWTFRKHGGSWGGGILVVQSPARPFQDACTGETAVIDPSSADIAGELTRVEGYTSSTDVDLTIDGHPATMFTGSSTSTTCDRVFGPPIPGLVRRVWLVDVDGQPLLIRASHQAPDTEADQDAIIGSITITSPDPSSPPEALASPTPVILRHWELARGPGRFQIDDLVDGKPVELTLPAGWAFDERTLGRWIFRRPGSGMVPSVEIQGPTSITVNLRRLDECGGSRNLSIDGQPATVYAGGGTQVCPEITNQRGVPQEIWLIDVDGKPLLISALLPTPDLDPDVDTIIHSITIGDR